MNKKLQRRWAPPGVTVLECRTLLATTTPTASWVGQDGHDLVGPYSTPGPDDVQDIHIALANLPADRTIVFANIAGTLGARGSTNGRSTGPRAPPPFGPAAAALVRTAGATTADLYIDPFQIETGQYFFIELKYDDQSSITVGFQGGTADPNLRMVGRSVALGWIGQDGRDWTSPGPSVGSDGYQDAHLSVANLSTTGAIGAATLTASGGGTWSFGMNPSLLPVLELIQDPADPTRGDLYFSPPGNLQGQTLSFTVLYNNGKTDGTTIVAGATDPNRRTPAPALVTLTWDTFQAAWVGQDGQDRTGPGDVHVALSGLPAGRS